MKSLAKSALKKTFPKLLYSYQLHKKRNSEPEIALLPELCNKQLLSIDIGANVGLYCKTMLQHSSAVIAFEPMRDMHEQLTQHFGSQLTIYPVALSSSEGTCELRMPRGNASWATIESSNKLELADEAIETYSVPMKTLDSYNFKNVGLIKIDVEGHEESVVRGGLATIAREKPNLIIEIEERHNKGAIERVTDLLSAIGYSVLFYEDGNYIPMSEFDVVRDQPIRNVSTSGKSGRYINNFIFRYAK
jgi:FkbM family methyltransferase